jgi:lysozyme
MRLFINLILLILPIFSIAQGYKGIDVSKFQGRIDWRNLDTSVKFVYIKATEGVTLKDVMFDYNWKNCRAIKGAYHFFRPNKSGVEQAKFFLSHVNFNKNNLIHVIDVEKMTYTVRYTKVKVRKGKKIYLVRKRIVTVDRKIAYHNLRDMVNYIKNKIGVYPIIYTTRFHWNSYYKGLFKGEHLHILWIADYQKETKDPIPPDGWNHWTIWQYSPRGKVRGISKPVDLNYSKVKPKKLLIAR